MKHSTFFFIVVLVLFGLLMRLLPHAPNFTPITSIAFVSSLYLGRRFSIILPLSALFLSDLFIGFYEWGIMLSVYGSFALIGCMSWFLKRRPSLSSVVVLIFSSSFLFFLITNAAVWLFSPWYEKSLSGLFYSYELGLPFWRNMMIGDIVYTALLFCVFEIAYVIGRAKFTKLSRKWVLPEWSVG